MDTRPLYMVVEVITNMEYLGDPVRSGFTIGLRPNQAMARRFEMKTVNYKSNTLG